MQCAPLFLNISHTLCSLQLEELPSVIAIVTMCVFFFHNGFYYSVWPLMLIYASAVHYWLILNLDKKEQHEPHNIALLTTGNLNNKESFYQATDNEIKHIDILYELDRASRSCSVALGIVCRRWREQIRRRPVEHLEDHCQPRRQVGVQVTVHEPHTCKQSGNKQDVQILLN